MGETNHGTAQTHIGGRYDPPNTVGVGGGRGSGGFDGVNTVGTYRVGTPMEGHEVDVVGGTE